MPWKNQAFLSTQAAKERRPVVHTATARPVWEIASASVLEMLSQSQGRLKTSSGTGGIFRYGSFIRVAPLEPMLPTVLIPYGGLPNNGFEGMIENRDRIGLRWRRWTRARGGGAGEAGAAYNQPLSL